MSGATVAGEIAPGLDFAPAIPPELSLAMGGDYGRAAAALAKAQGAMKPAELDGENPAYVRAGGKVHKYASLSAVWDAARAALAENQLAVIQLPSTDGTRVTLRTLLVHASGGWFGCSATATARDATPQAMGSAISYLRRYTFAAVVGVSQEDDDGNAASGVDGNGHDRPAQGSRGRQEPRERSAPAGRTRQEPQGRQEPPRAAAAGPQAVPDDERPDADTLLKLEKRLGHADLPAERGKAIRLAMDRLGVGFTEEGGVAEAGQLTQRRALSFIQELEREIRKAREAKTTNQEGSQ